jgi:hypothetical protein
MVIAKCTPVFCSSVDFVNNPASAVIVEVRLHVYAVGTIADLFECSIINF